MDINGTLFIENPWLVFAHDTQRAWRYYVYLRNYRARTSWATIKDDYAKLVERMTKLRYEINKESLNKINLLNYQYVSKLERRLSDLRDNILAHEQILKETQPNAIDYLSGQEELDGEDTDK